MLKSYTPPIGSPEREDYEKASKDGDITNKCMMELDNLIRIYQDKLMKKELNGLWSLERLQMLSELANKFTDVSKFCTTNNYVDHYRLAHSSKLIKQRVIIPILFSEADPTSERNFAHREQQADGMSGCSIELIAEILDDLEKYVSLDEDNRQKARGALQELTMTALLNRPQDGNFVVLPTGFFDDKKCGIDAYVYFVVGDEAYYVPISYKSTEKDAEIEKRLHPDLVVLSAESIGNIDTHISKLLVEECEGSPEFDEEETGALNNAQQMLFKLLFDQLSEKTIRPIQPRI